MAHFGLRVSTYNRYYPMNVFAPYRSPERARLAIDVLSRRPCHGYSPKSFLTSGVFHVSIILTDRLGGSVRKFEDDRCRIGWR
jgi:hypothetical protein